ncbi:MAG: YqgE/AlgH family protein, partial [Chthoniobacterales bacterium]|nr:YqgE/AlgH family protein [Chthoniobacterales bacterium]
TNQLMFAAFDWAGRDLLSLNQHVALDEATQLAEQDRSAIRAFVGYAGWTAGQLENELRQNAWVLQKPNRAALKPERLPRLWFEIMRNLGPWFKMLSAAPDDPSLN